MFSVERIDQLLAFSKQRSRALKGAAVFALDQIPGVTLGGLFGLFLGAAIEIRGVNTAVAAAVAVDEIARGLIEIKPLHE